MRQRQRTPDGRQCFGREQFPNFFSANCLRRLHAIGVDAPGPKRRAIVFPEHGQPGRTDRRVSKVREVEKAFIEAAALCREGVYDQARVEVRSREIPQWL